VLSFHALPRPAGQAVVQFVRATTGSRDYAIKLFANGSDYKDEKNLYQQSDLGEFMPNVAEFVDNEDGRFCDPHGNQMPPCIVMEKGETLTDRTRLCGHDVFTIVQVSSCESTARWFSRFLFS
jgi:hypothetical protein